jgi:hypothetical protein
MAVYIYSFEGLFQLLGFVNASLLSIPLIFPKNVFQDLRVLPKLSYTLFTTSSLSSQY